MGKSTASGEIRNDRLPDVSDGVIIARIVSCITDTVSCRPASESDTVMFSWPNRNVEKKVLMKIICIFFAKILFKFSTIFV